MIVSLAFVPPALIDVYFDALASSLPVELHPLLSWFEDYYIGRPERQGSLFNKLKRLIYTNLASEIINFNLFINFYRLRKTSGVLSDPDMVAVSEYAHWSPTTGLTITQRLRTVSSMLSLVCITRSYGGSLMHYEAASPNVISTESSWWRATLLGPR